MSPERGQLFQAAKRCLGTQNHVEDAWKALDAAHDARAITDDQYFQQSWQLGAATALLRAAGDFYLKAAAT